MHIYDNSQQVAEERDFCTYEEFLGCIDAKPKAVEAFKEHESPKVRAITLWQPWASLVALGLKKYETRSWTTTYKGKLLIHASKREIKQHELVEIVQQVRTKGTREKSAEIADLFSNTIFPLGAVVAIADLTQCLQMINGWVETSPEPGQTVIQAKSPLERAVGLWEPGRFAWRLENVQPLPQLIPCKGKQGLWIPSDDVIQQVFEEAGKNGLH